MTTENPALARYMDTFEMALRSYDCGEAGEILRDLRGHIAEAQTLGKPLDEVLASIGPADALARAYAVELELNPRGEELKQNVGSALRVVGILTAASFVTFMVVALLGTLAVGFVPTGLAVIVFSGMEAAGVEVPFLRLGPLHPLAGMAVGVLVTALGVAAGAGLNAYVRMLIRTLRRSLPRRATA